MINFFQFLIPLIVILNPISSLPVYIALWPHETQKQIYLHARLIALYVLVVLIITLLLGNILLQLIGLDIIYLKIAGGLVIAWIGWGFVTNTSSLLKMSKNSNRTDKSALLVPIAIPMIAGPGAISYVMTSVGQTGFVTMGTIIAVASFTVYLTIRFGYQIMGKLNPERLLLLERLVGLLLLGMGIQTILRNLIPLFT